MSELPIDDCRLQGELHDCNLEGTRVTLPVEKWVTIEGDRENPLHEQAIRWPNLSSSELMTCRREGDWNDDNTCSGDMMYIGVLPICLGVCIVEFCKGAIVKCDRREDMTEVKEACKGLNMKWKGLEKVARKKPEILQRVISAQLDL